MDEWMKELVRRIQLEEMKAIPVHQQLATPVKGASVIPPGSAFPLPGQRVSPKQPSYTGEGMGVSAGPPILKEFRENIPMIKRGGDPGNVVDLIAEERYFDALLSGLKKAALVAAGSGALGMGAPVMGATSGRDWLRELMKAQPPKYKGFVGRIGSQRGDLLGQPSPSTSALVGPVGVGTGALFPAFGTMNRKITYEDPEYWINKNK